MLRRFFFCLACVATMIALFYAEEDLRGQHAWESYMRQSKAKGIELDWRAYIPPPVADEQNFAMTPPFAGFFDYAWPTNGDRFHGDIWRDTNIWSRESRVTTISASGPAARLGDWVKGRPLDLKQWQRYFRSARLPETNYWPVPSQPQDPAHVLMALSKVEPDLAAIRQASARPQSRFPIHYEELPKALLVHLAYLKSVSHVLQLRAVAELQSGSNQPAFTDANLAFYCADALESEAFTVSQIVRCRMIEDGLQPIWEGLSAHRWSEDQIKNFQRHFSKMDLLARFDEMVKADMAFTCGWIETLSDDPSTFSMMEGGPNPIGAKEAAMDAHLLPRGWFYQNELCAARLFQDGFLPEVAPQIQRVYPGASRTNAELFDRLSDTPYSFVFKHLGGVISPQVFVHTQTDINLALVACALELFRMAHGHFPESLDLLAPEFLDALPHDIINGEPLKYRLTGAERFILYSVGWNEKDDGGAYPGPETPYGPGINRGMRSLSQYHPETGDWVWQQP
jgi:hypothetical protein